MCDYCGCRGVQPIGELMDEHDALGVQAHHVRAALGAGDHAAARTLLHALVEHLDRHVDREEDGIFRALRASGDFVDEVAGLEGEHRDLVAAVAVVDGLALEASSFVATVTALLDDLDVHIEREELGIFPVSVVTLGVSGWAIVDEAHDRSPSFLHDESVAQPTGLSRT
ncbi:hemerythrin domain-containing protein [Nocardioides sp.]|uniref:hemerythrin domain-containing protein n=1 Tax=Nocardioides sp. TaxID=35761 RepID=UPI00286AB34B|nr:hemerythrin domain-containing protein [Nocardioides sp.]